MGRVKRGAAFMGLGFEIVGLIVAAVWLGGWLDTKYSLKGLASAGLIVLALCGWLIHLIYLIRQYQRETR